MFVVLPSLKLLYKWLPLLLPKVQDSIISRPKRQVLQHQQFPCSSCQHGHPWFCSTFQTIKETRGSSKDLPALPGLTLSSLGH